MRTFYRVKWAVRVKNGGPNGISLQIDWPKMVKIYPFLEGANFCKPAKSVNEKPTKKKKLSPAEQAKLYRKLLDSGKIKNKAAIARKFGVSRAWVTKVMSA
jgi:hypothetical protein